MNQRCASLDPTHKSRPSSSLAPSDSCLHPTLPTNLESSHCKSQASKSKRRISILCLLECFLYDGRFGCRPLVRFLDSCHVQSSSSSFQTQFDRTQTNSSDILAMRCQELTLRAPYTRDFDLRSLSRQIREQVGLLYSWRSHHGTKNYNRK